ncbi:MAG: hypothetical protein H7Y62_04905, partial [Hyphomicrobium sp.]|nr:hypothetical protein [Hyphomicrobium sp.]
AILKALRAEGIDVPYASALAGHAHGPAPTARQASISIGVPHDSDPEAVQAALKEAARQGGFAADSDGKGPQVAFDDISDNALNFSVTVPLVEGISAEDAETALRTQAVKALRARGIALASPQRQVRLRDLEGLRTFVMKLAEERARSAQARKGEDATMPPRKPDND